VTVTVASGSGTRVIANLVNPCLGAVMLGGMDGRRLMGIDAEVGHARPRQLQRQQDGEDDEKPTRHEY
jgi:hypothetical protein